MKKGFTLIELIVVVIIIGILATIAVPQYLKATERAKGGKGKEAMTLIAQAEKMYRAQYDKYTGVLADVTEFVEMSQVTGDTDWSYVVTGTTTQFTATATRLGGSNSGETWIFGDGGIWSGSFTP